MSSGENSAAVGHGREAAERNRSHSNDRCSQERTFVCNALNGPDWSNADLSWLFGTKPIGREGKTTRRTIRMALGPPPLRSIAGCATRPRRKCAGRGRSPACIEAKRPLAVSRHANGALYHESCKPLILLDEFVRGGAPIGRRLRPRQTAIFTNYSPTCRQFRGDLIRCADSQESRRTLQQVLLPAPRCSTILAIGMGLRTKRAVSSSRVVRALSFAIPLLSPI